MSEKNDGKDKGQMSQEDRDHHADQHNPNNPAHQDRADNRSDQLNPNNPKYDKAREDEKK